MLNHLVKSWFHLFIVERPSISLSAFRVAVAVTLGSVMLPTFSHLSDTYLSTAFKTYNAGFFPVWFIKLVGQSQDWLVVFMVGIFCLAWLFFLIGYRSQLSCIAVTACSYYFYALNSFAMGTLSWDILLVTMFLMCVTDYHSDYFSIDSLRRGEETAYARRRPYFIQRLLQLQIGFTFFYTALYKISAQGNWLTGNPIYYLMNYPRPGVVKYFMLKDFLIDKPQLCYVIGLVIVAVELSMIFLLFWRKTRMAGIYLGIFFHLLLILTLDVPATFFFLFPAQLLLFINPENVLQWIERKQQWYAKAPRYRVIFDGKCRFCRAALVYVEIADLFKRFDFVDLHTIDDFKVVHPRLSKEEALKQMVLLDPHGELAGGFFAFRRMLWYLPMFYPLLAVFYFPAMGILGPLVYRFIAKHRYLIPLPRTMKMCADDSCNISK